MLDLASHLTMPVKDTIAKIAKPEDCIVSSKTTPKRSPVEGLMKGVTGTSSDGSGGEELMLEVTCGQNQAALYMSRLQLGSKGTCVLFENSWLTPNEFQYISGRETAKDWKRSIKHHGKSLKVLISKGILTTSPLRCNCGQCTQVKDKDASKYVLREEPKLANNGPLRDTLVADTGKVSNTEAAKDGRYIRVPGDSNEKLTEGLRDTTMKQPQSVSEKCTSHSPEGSRYPPSCDKGMYGAVPDSSYRFDRPEGYGHVGGCSTQGGYTGKFTDVTGQEHKTSLDVNDVKLKAKRKADEAEEFSGHQNKLQGPENSELQKVEGSKTNALESSQHNTSSSGQKKCASSGTQLTTGGLASWNHGNPGHNSEQSCYLSHDKTKKSTTSQSTTSSSLSERTSCIQASASPSGKNSLSNSGRSMDSSRLASESSFIFPSFGSPYYPMISASQLPAYYANPYMWPFPTNPSGCSYGWTAPSEIAAPNCLRSPVKDSLDCNTATGEQAFNFPWMKRASYSTSESQPVRDGASDSISAGKRKYESDALDYFPPAKHPFYLSDGLRPAFGEAITWSPYNPTAPTLDFRFLQYSLPSYIPDGRATQGMFANNFLKSSENVMTGNLGLYPGFFPSPCLGVNSR